MKEKIFKKEKSERLLSIILALVTIVGVMVMNGSTVNAEMNEPTVDPDYLNIYFDGNGEYIIDDFNEFHDLYGWNVNIRLAKGLPIKRIMRHYYSVEGGLYNREVFEVDKDNDSTWKVEFINYEVVEGLALDATYTSDTNSVLIMEVSHIRPANDMISLNIQYKDGDIIINQRDIDGSHTISIGEGESKTFNKNTVPDILNGSYTVAYSGTLAETESMKFVAKVIRSDGSVDDSYVVNRNYWHWSDNNRQYELNAPGIVFYGAFEDYQQEFSSANITGPAKSVTISCKNGIIEILYDWRNHDFSKYVSNEDGTHKVVCKDCDIVQIDHESDTCSGGTATCKAKAVCSACGAEYGSLAAHNGGTATCTAKAVCTVCNKEYGSLAEHSYSKVNEVSATYEADGIKEYYACSCGSAYEDKELTKPITNLAAWKTGSGKIDRLIKETTGDSECGAAKSIALSKTVYTYDGKVKKPSVVVKDSKGKKIASSNYTVTYDKGLKAIGEYKVTIKFKGNYSGSKTLKFKIVPKTTTVSKATPGSKKLTVSVKPIKSNVNGYEIQIATDSKFTKGVKKTTTTKTSVTFKSLKKGTKYFVRVRTYKTVGKKKIYSGWKAYSKQLKIK